MIYLKKKNVGWLWRGNQRNSAQGRFRSQIPILILLLGRKMAVPTCVCPFLLSPRALLGDRLLINTESMFPLISSPITVNLARAVFS